MTLKELRKQHKLSGRQVAKEISCDPSSYYRYENGERSIPFDVLKKLAKFYAVPITDLMDIPTNIRVKADKNQDVVTPEADSLNLSDTEIEMIYAYRGADSRAQSDALKILQAHTEEID